jgi:hypothetical protein
VRIFNSIEFPRPGKCYIIHTSLGRKLIKVTRVEAKPSSVFWFRKLRASSKKWTLEETGMFFGSAGTEIREPSANDNDLLRIARAATNAEGERS